MVSSGVIDPHVMKALCPLSITHFYQEIGALLILSAEAVEELSKDQVSVEVVQYKTKDFLRSLEVTCQPGLAYLQPHAFSYFVK